MLTTADLSKRYTNLLSQTHAANKVFKELTMLEGGVADADALEGWVRMVTGKVDMMNDELRRLQEKLRCECPVILLSPPTFLR